MEEEEEIENAVCVCYVELCTDQREREKEELKLSNELAPISHFLSFSGKGGKRGRRRQHQLRWSRESKRCVYSPVRAFLVRSLSNEWGLQRQNWPQHKERLKGPISNFSWKFGGCSLYKHVNVIGCLFASKGTFSAGASNIRMNHMMMHFPAFIYYILLNK